MKMCKHVILVDNACSHKLEEIEKDKYKLKELVGVILFCESEDRGLVMRLKNKFDSSADDKEIIWAFEKTRPISAVCGQELRCFYEETYQNGYIEEVKMDGYELSGMIHGTFDEMGILRRGLKPATGYKWVEYN